MLPKIDCKDRPDLGKADIARGKGRPRCFDMEKALCAALKIFWEKGYEPTSVAELCRVMKINPPSLYCSFGNKAALFLAAIEHYEKKYWTLPARNLMREPDLYRAIENYFAEAARILLSPDCPCGCMVVLAAVNISPVETEIIETIRSLRAKTTEMFAKRLSMAAREGQIPRDANIPALAGALHIFLEGMSLQARDNVSLPQLLEMAARVTGLLPPRAGA